MRFPLSLQRRNCHIPVVIHESDLTPGLANKLSIPYASKVCCNFPETIIIFRRVKQS